MFTCRRCCICSANYCKFRLVSLLVWLVDMIALFLMMWPLSWYQFCVSLPLEVRTVGLVLFLQVLTLLSVLHCLRQPVILSLCSVTACSVQPCVATTVSYTTQRRKCCLPPVPPLSPATVDITFCLWKPLPHLPPSSPPADHTSITSRHCVKRAQKLKATLIEKRREEWTDEDQSDRRFSLSTFIRFFQLSNPMSTHHFFTTFLSTQWPWRPLSLLAQCSTASPSQTAASHSP